MKRTLILILLLLAAAPAAAQERAPAAATRLSAFEADFFPGYRAVGQEGNTRSGEYEHLRSSGAGALHVEWDPLPQRLLMEGQYLNAKDWFGDLDYAYGDIVTFGLSSLRSFHNLDHLSLGADDPATASPSVTDLSPADRYGLENTQSRALMRLKTPDFPFHLYVEAKQQERHGTVQQRFLRALSGFDKASRGRAIDYETEEVKATVNGHAGPVEIEYSRAEKEFTATRGKVLVDTTGSGLPHNLTPDLESSIDTVKVHTSHTGRVSAAATYSAGDRENKDSGAKAAFWNGAGDLTLMPTRDLALFLKYRHYDVNLDTPDTVAAATASGPVTYNVRNGVISQRDTVSGSFRYRVSQEFAVRGEFAWESLFRDVWPGYDALPAPPAGAPADWTLDRRVSRVAAKLGASYRLSNRLWLRADAGRQSADVPDDSRDNTYADTVDTAKASLSWSPARWATLLVSGGTVLEERERLAAPLAGPRKSQRDQALGTVTILAGQKTSVTAGYAFFQNRTDSSVAYPDGTGTVVAETGVPYADRAHTASLSATHAVKDAVSVTAEAGRTYARGGFRVSGAVAGSDGIPQLTNLKVVESVYAAMLAVRYTKYLGTELRYRYTDYDDQLDNAQDGTTQTALALLTLRW